MELYNTLEINKIYCIPINKNIHHKIEKKIIFLFISVASRNNTTKPSSAERAGVRAGARAGPREAR